MSNVRRYVIPSAYMANQDVDIAGIGLFTRGVLDVDVYNSSLIASVTAQQAQYGIIDLGVMDRAYTVQVIVVSPTGAVLTDASMASQISSGPATQAALKTVVDAEITVKSGIRTTDITDSTTVGRSVLTASNGTAARLAIGAGTSTFSGAYSDLTGQPALSAVATSGSYPDLANRPDLTPYATTSYVNSAVAGVSASATTPWVSFTDSRVGGKMDGTTDNGPGGTNALNVAFSLLGSAGGVIWFPPGTAKFATQPPVIPSNIRLVGSGKNATILKKTANFDFLRFAGASTSSRCQRGGLADIQLNGSTSTTGALLVATYADHMNFDRVWFYLNGDCAVVATELWDSYFAGCEFEWCGTSVYRTGAVVRLLGSATDSTNEIYFSQCRWESFPGHALFADSNSGGHAPYGIWLTQCKMESAQIAGTGAFIETTSDVADVHIRDIYLAADGKGTGGSAVYALIYNPAAANFTIEGVHAWINGSSANSVIGLFPGPVGHSISNVYVDAPTLPSNGIVNFAGGSPVMRVRNVRYKFGQAGTVFTGTVPAGTLIDDMESTATAAPTTGTWLVGSRVWNSAPTASGIPGWICTVAGTPGTWKAMGNLAA